MNNTQKVKVFASLGPEDTRAEFCWVPRDEYLYEMQFGSLDNALIGIMCKKGTSLFTVVERASSNWFVKALQKWAAEHGDRTLEHAAQFNVGDVLTTKYDWESEQWTYQIVEA
jgi:hypothetical protein